MLDVRDVSATYGQHRALETVSLCVNRAEIVVILGANGAGKSTLLKAISGICEGQVTGSISLSGHELVDEQPHRIVEHGIALVPEGRGIFADLNVEENLLLGAYPARARDQLAQRFEQVYALFPKLRERRNQVVRTMSGGEQQMVAIGRAMMSNPAVLTLDEPSLGLSPLLCKELFQNLKTVRETGIGILLVEQNARASLAIADRGYLLENAHVTHQDSAEKLARDPAVQKAYLGGSVKSTTVGPVVHVEPRAPAGPKPSDIAAAAMLSFAKPAPPKIVAPAPRDGPADTGLPRPATPVEPPKSGLIKGVQIDALVTQARVAAKPKHDVRIPARPLPKRPAHAVSLPDLGAHDDRLKAVLQDIEDAAKNARKRSPYSGPKGRKLS